MPDTVLRILYVQIHQPLEQLSEVATITVTTFWIRTLTCRHSSSLTTFAEQIRIGAGIQTQRSGSGLCSQALGSHPHELPSLMKIMALIY